MAPRIPIPGTDINVGPDIPWPGGVEGGDAQNPEARAPDPNKPVTRVPNKPTMDPADYIGIVVQTGWYNTDKVTSEDDKSAGDFAANRAWVETRGTPAQVNPQAVGGGCSGPGSHHATGMFQIVPACWPLSDEAKLLSDPHYNSAEALKIYQRSGWTPWGGNATSIPWFGDPLDDAFPGSTPAQGLLWWRREAGNRGYLDGGYNPFTGATTQVLPDAINDVVEPIIDAAQAGWDFLALLTKWETWKRILFVVAGGLLAYLGVQAITADLNTPLLPTIGKG